MTNASALTHCYNGAANEATIAIDHGTYLGSFFTIAAGQTSMQQSPAAAAGGSNPILALYNAYNRVNTCAVEQDNTLSWTYSPGPWRQANNSNYQRVTWLDGLKQSTTEVNLDVSTSAYGSPAGALLGVDFNSVSAVPNHTGQVNPPGVYAGHVTTASPPSMGLAYAQAMEAVAGSGTVTFYGLSNGQVNQLTVCLTM